MAGKEENDAYLTPYREAQSEHGPGFGVTLWASRRSQRLRFEVLTQMAFMVGKRVLDAGCSRGDFAAYLLERHIKFGRYIGVDGLAEVIDHARGRGLRGTEFVHGDFLTHPELLKTGQPQIIAISGSLNTMDDEQVYATLDAAWEAAEESLIFNFLSDRAGAGAPPQEYPARRLSTMRLLDWALSRTPLVRFRQDYFPHGHDATVLMGKAAKALATDERG